MNSLNAGQGLGRGESLSSSTGKFVLTLQDDGNLVLSEGGSVVWASGTNGQGVDRLAVQDDGNVVLYAGGDSKWSTGTNGKSGVRLDLQDDRNVVLYGGDGSVLWATGTNTDQGDAPVVPEPAAEAVAAAETIAPAAEAPVRDTQHQSYKEYIVQEGDTLSGIALAHYGDANLYPQIAAFNGIANPDLINVGQKVLLPENPRAI